MDGIAGLPPLPPLPAPLPGPGGALASSDAGSDRTGLALPERPVFDFATFKKPGGLVGGLGGLFTGIVNGLFGSLFGSPEDVELPNGKKVFPDGIVGL